jgi:type I restriction enzyme S subunit
VSDHPEGWRETTLSGVAMVNMGQSPPGEATNSDGHGLPLVGGASEFHDGRILASRYTATPTKVAEPNDIIFCIRATIGKVAVADQPVCLGRGVAGFRALDADTNWLRYLLVHLGPEIDAAGTGTTFRQVDKQTLSDWPVLLPPLPEQHGIAAKLDSLSGRTARAREELGRIPKLIQKYREVILAAAFSGALTMEWRQNEGTKVAWTKRHVGRIISAIIAGKNLRCEERPPRENENGVVKVSAVTWGAFDPSAAKTLPSNFIPLGRARIRAADFLISRANTLELVGAVVIVDRTPDNLFLSDKILRLEMEDIHKRWLLWFLRSPNGRKAIEESATGNQLSMRNLSQAALSKIVLPWPEEEERQEIVRRIETAFAWLDRVSAEHANASRLLPKLDQAILAKAFRGELVLQDVNDNLAELNSAPAAEARDVVVV